MSQVTGIEWTDSTWNPVRGCSRVSAGCKHCYAELIAARFSGPGQPYEGLARWRSNGEPQWTGEARIIEKHLTDPLRWRKPRRVFVNSMSDLFHEKVSDGDLDRIFAVMAFTHWHTFQILTKRPERMRDYLREIARSTAESKARWDAARLWLREQFAGSTLQQEKKREYIGVIMAYTWVQPIPNIWVGVSVEDQRAADERIPLLLDTPAAVRFLSCEPLLGPVDLCISAFNGTDSFGALEGLSWIIAGGESGPGARPCDLAWIRNIIAQCADADVACFVKQLGSNPIDPWADTGALVNDRESAVPRFRDRKGGDFEEFPSDLRVREFPNV